MRRLINLVEDASTMISPFQRWFEGSKTVDAAGKPMKLFHGTSKDTDFKSFKMPRNGVWFTNDAAEASNYAKENDSQNIKYDNGKYVHVNTASRVIPAYVKIVNPIYLTEWPDEMQAENYKRAQGIYFDRLRQQGHDGIIFKDGMIVVALGGPEQIKSAVGNVTFDPKKKGLTEINQTSS